LGFPRGFKARANRIAVDIRRRMGLQPIDPIDPAEICRAFDIDLMRLAELGDPPGSHCGIDESCFSAVTVPCGGRTAIVHNCSHHPWRQRSNICHELAHCFLGHPCSPPLTAEGERVHDGGIEAEANFLGGALLVTNEAAVHILLNGLMPRAQNLYGVSRPMLNFRLRMSGAFAIQQRAQNTR
jgi:hypothetical protein